MTSLSRLEQSQIYMLAQIVRGSNEPLTEPFVMTIPYARPDMEPTNPKFKGIGFDVSDAPPENILAAFLESLGNDVQADGFSDLETIAVFPNQSFVRHGTRAIGYNATEIKTDKPQSHAASVLKFADGVSTAHQSVDDYLASAKQGMTFKGPQ